MFEHFLIFYRQQMTLKDVILFYYLVTEMLQIVALYVAFDQCCHLISDGIWPAVVTDPDICLILQSWRDEYVCAMTFIICTFEDNCTQVLS